jgi:hypothetical protein
MFQHSRTSGSGTLPHDDQQHKQPMQPGLWVATLAGTTHFGLHAIDADSQLLLLPPLQHTLRLLWNKKALLPTDLETQLQLAVSRHGHHHYKHCSLAGFVWYTPGLPAHTCRYSSCP